MCFIIFFIEKIEHKYNVFINIIIRITIRMSQFTTNTNTNIDTIVKMIDYPIESIPRHIIESNHFKDLLEIYPGETVFPFYNTSFSSTLEIHSQADIDLIMESEYRFMFSHDSRVEILRNIYKYWMEDPNSSSIELPEDNYSWFANQVLSLFEDRDSAIIMTCMKMNYVELFDFIIERDGLIAIEDASRLSIYSLLYYAVYNGNVEILRRGIEVGCELSIDLIDIAVKMDNLEIVTILIENGLTPTNKTGKIAAEHASPELFCMILDKFVFIVNKDLLIPALNNLDNLKELVLNRKIRLDSMDSSLLREALAGSKDLDVINFIEEQFKLTWDDILKISKFIPESVIKNDNLKLYNYLRTKGFYVRESLITSAIHNKCMNITPGLIRKHCNDE